MWKNGGKDENFTVLRGNNIILEKRMWGKNTILSGKYMPGKKYLRDQNNST